MGESRFDLGVLRAINAGSWHWCTGLLLLGTVLGRLVAT